MTKKTETSTQVAAPSPWRPPRPRWLLLSLVYFACSAEPATQVDNTAHTAVEFSAELVVGQSTGNGPWVVASQAECGNGIVDPGEACDPGRETATCDWDCTLVACGDGTVNPVAGEQCDEGDDNSNSRADACRSNCELPSCADGVLDSGERCPFA